MAVDSQPLKDINTDIDYYQAHFLVNQIVQVGNAGYFAFEDSAHGRELWRTDGTSEGTRMETDLLSGSQSSNPRQLMDLGESLIFIADTEDSQLALYRLGPHDLAPVVLKKWEGIASSSSFLIVDDLAYFAAIDERGVAGLWITDGNRLTQASLPDSIVVNLELQLWRVGNRVLFKSWEVHERSSIVSYDGRTDEAQIIFTGRSDLQPMAQDAVFIRTLDDSYTERVWFSDGTIAGTKSVENSYLWYWGHFRAPIEVEHGWVTILSDSNHRYRDLVSISRDGVVRPILKLETANQIANFLVAVNDKAVLVVPGSATYVTDGSVVTTLVFDSPVLNNATALADAVVWNEKLVATVYNEYSAALLTLDFADKTVQVIANMQTAEWPGTHWKLDVAEPNRLLVYESANKTLKEWNGSELRLIGGEVGRIAPGTMFGSSYVTMIATHQGIYPARLESDLIPLSTAIALPNLSGLAREDSIVWNDQVFFLAYGAHGLDLWRTDGTSDGTKRLLKDIGSNVRLVATNSRVLAIGETGDGFQVWQSNGVPDGSSLIGAAPFQELSWVVSSGDKIIVCDPIGVWSFDLKEWTRVFTTHRIGNSNISSPIQFGSSMIFRFWEGAWTVDGEYVSSNSLWQTDGTIRGTLKLIDNLTYTIDRFVTEDDWIYFTSNNIVYRTKDRFLNIETVVELSGSIVDLTIFDDRLYVLQSNELLGALSLMRWNPESDSMVRLADYNWSWANWGGRSRFFQSDSVLFIKAMGFHSRTPIFQRIDTRADSVHTIPAMNLFATTDSWGPKALSIGLVGPGWDPMLGQEVFMLRWEDLKGIDDSIPLGLLVDSVDVPEDTDLNTPFALLSTMAREPGFYRYELAAGENDNASFDIVGDRLINRVSFDRSIKNQFDLDIRTISNSGASGVFRVTFFVVPSDVAPQAIDDWCVMWPGQIGIISPLENDIAGTNGMDGATIQFVSTPVNGEWQIVGNLIRFTPDIDFVGYNTIQYVIIDRKGNVGLPATIDIRVVSHFQNFEKPADVDTDGHVGLLDVLTVINYLNEAGTQFLDQSSANKDTHRVDVDGDGIVSPLDVLSVINWIQSEWDWDEVGEGESEKDDCQVDYSLDAMWANDEINYDRFLQASEEEWFGHRNRRLLSR